MQNQINQLENIVNTLDNDLCKVMNTEKYASEMYKKSQSISNDIFHIKLAIERIKKYL